MSTLAGSGQWAFADGLGTAAKFKAPRGLWLAINGDLWFADRGNNRIRVMSSSGIFTFCLRTFLRSTANLCAGFVSTLTGSGTAGYADGVGSLSSFNQPWGTSGYADVVFVSDDGNLRIRRIASSGAVVFAFLKSIDCNLCSNCVWLYNVGVSTFAGSGASSLADGLGTVASFNSPMGLSASSSGTVFVAEGGNSRIRMITTSGFLLLVLFGSIEILMFKYNWLMVGFYCCCRSCDNPCRDW